MHGHQTYDLSVEALAYQLGRTATGDVRARARASRKLSRAVRREARAIADHIILGEAGLRARRRRRTGLILAAAALLLAGAAILVL